MDNNYIFDGFEKDADRDRENRSYEFYEVNKTPVPAAPAAEPYKEHKAKREHKSGTGRRFGLTITMALVFGLVAGLVFQGVNLVGSKVLGTGSGKNTTVDNVQMAPQATGATSGGTASEVDKVSAETLSVADIARNAMPSVVAITAVSVQEIQDFWGGTQQYEGVGSGSGILIGQNDDELLIATNNHVVTDARDLSVSFYGSEVDATALNESQTSVFGRDAGELAKEYAKNSVSAQIKGTDAENDLAVIAVKKKDVPQETMDQIKVAVMGDSASLVVGEQVVAIGNALGYGQSVTSGYVSALDRSIDASESGGEEVSGLIQTDAAINPGNSGGALLNMKGEVIGINSAKFADTTVEGMGFAIPLATAEPILDNLMTRETRSKVSEDQAAYLGISCKAVSAEASQMYNIPIGVFVADVEPGGAAEKAGVKSGDVLVKIDDIKISSYDELTERLAYYAAGETIDIVVARANGGEYQEKTLSITLGSRPES